MGMITNRCCCPYVIAFHTVPLSGSSSGGVSLVDSSAPTPAWVTHFNANESILCVGSFIAPWLYYQSADDNSLKRYNIRTQTAETIYTEAEITTTSTTILFFRVGGNTIAGVTSFLPGSTSSVFTAARGGGSFSIVNPSSGMTNFVVPTTYSAPAGGGGLYSFPLTVTPGGTIWSIANIINPDFTTSRELVSDFTTRSELTITVTEVGSIDWDVNREALVMAWGLGTSRAKVLPSGEEWSDAFLPSGGVMCAAFNRIYFAGAHSSVSGQLTCYLPFGHSEWHRTDWIAVTTNFCLIPR